MNTQTKQRLKKAFLNRDFYILIVGMIIFIMISRFNCPSAQYHKITWVLISAFMNMWLIKNWTDGLKQ
jgi:hypothetical protein